MVWVLRPTFDFVVVGLDWFTVVIPAVTVANLFGLGPSLNGVISNLYFFSPPQRFLCKAHLRRCDYIVAVHVEMLLCINIGVYLF